VVVCELWKKFDILLGAQAEACTAVVGMCEVVVCELWKKFVILLGAQAVSHTLLRQEV
jgi:hypothetical protein